uniref:Uncharacterized protein n=2 Tax=Schistocephalus solidus TaxID=70667 RepID=A0A0X3Q7I0_SCHSO
MLLGRRIFIDALAIVSAIWLLRPLSCGTAVNQTRHTEQKDDDGETLSPGAITGIVFGVAAGVVIIGFVLVACLRCHSSRMARRREKMIIPSTFDTDTHFHPSDFNRHSAFYDARSLGSSHSIDNAANYAAHIADQPPPTTFTVHASSLIPPRVNHSPRASKVTDAVTTLLDRVSNLRRGENQSIRETRQQQNLQAADLSNSPSVYPSLAGFVHQNPDVKEEAATVSPPAIPIVPAFECRQMFAVPGPAHVNQETPCETVAAVSVRQIQSFKSLFDATSTATSPPLQSPLAMVPTIRDLSIDTASPAAAAGITTPRFSTTSSSFETSTRPSVDSGGRRNISVSVREMTRRLFAAMLNHSVDEGEEAGQMDDIDGPQSTNIGVESSRRVFKSRAIGGCGGRRTGIRPGGHKTSNAFGSTSSLTSSRGGGGGGGAMNALSVSGISERLARRKNKQAKNRQSLNEGHYNVNAMGDAAEMDELDAPLDNDHFLHSLESAVFNGIYEHHAPKPPQTLYTHFDEVTAQGVDGGSTRNTTVGHFSDPHLLTSATGTSMLQAGDLGLLDVYGLGYVADECTARISYGKQHRLAPRRPFLPPGSPVIGFAFQQLRQQPSANSGVDGEAMQPRQVSGAGEHAEMGSVSTIATVLAPGATVHNDLNSSATGSSSSSSLNYQGESTPTPLCSDVSGLSSAAFSPAETLAPPLRGRPLPAPVARDLRPTRHIPQQATSPISLVGGATGSQMDSPPADSGHAGSSDAVEVGRPATLYDETDNYDFHFAFGGAVEEEESADPTLRLETFDSVDDSDLGAGGSSIDSASEMLPSKPLATVTTNRRRTLMHLRSPSMPGCALSPLLPACPGLTTTPGEVLQLPVSKRSLSVTHLIPLQQNESLALGSQLPARDRRWKSRAVKTWLSEDSWRNLPSTAALEPSSEVR